MRTGRAAGRRLAPSHPDSLDHRVLRQHIVAPFRGPFHARGRAGPHRSVRLRARVCAWARVGVINNGQSREDHNDARTQKWHHPKNNSKKKKIS